MHASHHQLQQHATFKPNLNCDIILLSLLKCANVASIERHRCSTILSTRNSKHYRCLTYQPTSATIAPERYHHHRILNWISCNTTIVLFRLRAPTPLAAIHQLQGMDVVLAEDSQGNGHDSTSSTIQRVQLKFTESSTTIFLFYKPTPTPMPLRLAPQCRFN
jgi:hypothetical protein